MHTTVLKAIIAFVFGYKYYANIIYTKGTPNKGLSSFIFSTKEAAYRHRDSLAVNNRSYGYIETVSFRSRRIYPEEQSI